MGTGGGGGSGEGGRLALQVFATRGLVDVSWNNFGNAMDEGWGNGH